MVSTIVSIDGVNNMHDSTPIVVSPIPPRVGRKRINAEDGDKVTARFPEGTLVRVKAVLRDGEPQSAFIRDAVLAELERREEKG